MTEEKQKVIGVLKSLIEFLEEEPGETGLSTPLRSRSAPVEMTGDGAGLKEPRIMTRDEIIGWDGYIWLEFEGMKAMKAVLIDHGMRREPYERDVPTKYLAWKIYQKTWRAWTGQPTDEQRKAEAWK